MTSSSYFPNEPKNTIIQEGTWLQGAFLTNIFFGIQTTLCVLAFLSIHRKRNPKFNRMRIALLTYLVLLCAVTTAGQGLSLNWIHMGFITQRNYPGGPSAFFDDEFALPVNFASNVLVVFANWMMESLLVWRCRVVWGTGEQLWWLGVAIPFFLLIAVFVTGGLFVYHTLHSQPPVVYVIAYSVSSLLLNFTATGFIAGRLLVHRHRVVSQLGRGHGRHYVSIAAVVVESAAMYTGFLVIVIVTFAIDSPLKNILQQVIVQIQAIATLLIIWRIASGEGWSKQTDTEVVSAVVSSWNTRMVQQRDQSLIQLNPLSSSTRPDEEEIGPRRKEDGRRMSFSNDAEVGHV